MTPDFNKKGFSRFYETTEENTAMHRRKEEENEICLNHCNNNQNNSSPFSLGSIEKRDKESLPQTDSFSDQGKLTPIFYDDSSRDNNLKFCLHNSDKLLVLKTKETCQSSSLSHNIFHMNQIGKNFNIFSFLFTNSKKPNISYDPQQGNLNGNSVVPVLKKVEQSYLKSSMRSSFCPATMREKLSSPSKMVVFQLEEDSQKIPDQVKDNEEIVQELERNSFYCQEEIERYSATFAQYQNKLNKKIKEISTINSEKANRQIQLQTELNTLRLESAPEMFGSRTEIKNELKKLKATPETDPQKLLQIAQLYDEIYPSFREDAQQMLDWIQENPERQHELAAAILADATIKVLEMASKTVALHEVVPIQRDEWANNSKKPFDVPYKTTNVKLHEIHKLPSKDLEDEIVIKAANHAIENLQDSKKILKKILEQRAPEEIANDLREAEIQKALRDYSLSTEKESFLGTKLTPWLNIPLEKREKNYLTLTKPIRNEVKLARIKSQALNKIFQEKKTAQPLLDLSDIKGNAIANALYLIQSGLDAADGFREMLLERIEKK